MKTVKVILSIIASLVIAGMDAQNKLYIEVGSSNTASKIPVSIFMTNDVAIAGLQASFSLPEGLTKDNFIYDEDEEQYIELNTGRCAKAFVNAKAELFPSSMPNCLLLSLTASTSGKTIAAGDGLIGTFYFDASKLANGTYAVKQFAASVFPDAFTRYDMDNMEASFTIVHGQVLGTKESSNPSYSLGLDDQIAYPGSQVVVPIHMNTAEDNIKNLQFDIVLPSGIEVATEDDEYLINLTSRASSSHIVGSNRFSNGNYRVLVTSQSNQTFKGTEGAIMKVTLNIPKDVKPGEYEIQITNIELNTTSDTAIRPSSVKAKMDVKDYLLGDVNGDGIVSVTDVGMTVSYILHINPTGFNKVAADLNGDGMISVTDVGILITKILTEE